MTTTTPIIFYDIAFRPPYHQNSLAPNPWKTRYALNFKKVPYSTTWVPLGDIARVRKAIGASASRKFADGSDFYTLPVITDSTTKSVVGDSFDIAVYLQKTYPNSGAGDLFPPQTLDFVCPHEIAILVPLSPIKDNTYPEYARFNMNVDAAFTVYTRLMVHAFPFDPATAEANKAEFVRRAGVASWDDLAVRGEERKKIMVSFRDTLAPLAKLFERDSSGPFILGKQPSYADLIVGGWLKMSQTTLPENEWEELAGWHGGVFGRLHQALKQFAHVDIGLKSKL
jgi:glutathione S-transferase